MLGEEGPLGRPKELGRWEKASVKAQGMSAGVWVRRCSAGPRGSSRGAGVRGGHPLGHLAPSPGAASRASWRLRGARAFLPRDLPSAARSVGRAKLQQGGRRTWVTIHLKSLINIFQLRPFWVPFPAALVQASTKSPRQ